MGLGKTLQTISLFGWVYEQYGVRGPHLVICPLSVLSSWMAELARWLPSFKAVRLHGPAIERDRIKLLLRSEPFDICVTTCAPDLLLQSQFCAKRRTDEAFQAEQSALKHLAAVKSRWQYLVLDEGHRIKNPKANAT